MKTKTSLFFSTLLVVAFLSCKSNTNNDKTDTFEQSKEKGQPNIVLIMADDLGWGDVGYNGHDRIKTPHLDIMSKKGAKFNRFYSAGPVCSPTRGSLLTGRNPNRYGITNANVGHLKREEVTLAEVFKANGYTTGHFGKWHLGTLFSDFSGKGDKRKPKENHLTPRMAGFNEWFSTEFAVATYNPYTKDREHSHSKYWLEDNDPRVLYVENGKAVEYLEGCDSEIIVDRAVPFIEKSVKENKPFFTVIWFHAPHAPVVGHPKYMTELYSDLPIEQQHYYSVVTALDAQVGRLRAKLRELGIADNTIVCFTSDNGPEGNPDKVHRHQGSASHFRGRKRSLYEGGVRVPGIIEWPAVIKPNTEINMPAVTSDYFPTLCNILGYDILERPYDGIDIIDVLKGKDRERKNPIGFYYLNQKQESLIDDRYKLVHNLGDKRPRSDNGKTPFETYELYDLLEDPSETMNIANTHSDITETMSRQLAGFVSSCKRSNNGEDYEL